MPTDTLQAEEYVVANTTEIEAVPVGDSDREILRWLETEEQPLLAALSAMERWLYIHKVAAAALEGKVVDGSLPQIMANPARYLAIAVDSVAVLSDWLARHGLDAAD